MISLLNLRLCVTDILAYGMRQMNGLDATITAVNVGNNTITLDIDSDFNDDVVFIG